MTGLTEAKIKTLNPGRHGFGDGLWLEVGAGRSWSLRFMTQGKARQMGLGAWPGVTLPEARKLAAEARAMARRGVDPIEARRRERAEAAVEEARSITFKAAATAFIAEHRAGWRNPKHAAQWTATLETYAYPIMGAEPVGDVTTDHVLRVLRPIWTKKPETASRVRGRIETVIASAIAQGQAKEPNVARWHNHLQMVLIPRSKVAEVRHHPALPWPEMPTFMSSLRSHESAGAWALSFAIVTAARSGEVRGATWAEINLDAALWTVPGSRMKAKREHVVPLSPAALAVLDKAKALPGAGLIFPGTAAHRPLSDMTLTAVLRRMGRADITAHGMRASFKTWASDRTEYPRELIEAALAHSVGDKAEQAYQRGTWLERRRRLMVDWAAFCAGGATPEAEGAG